MYSEKHGINLGLKDVWNGSISQQHNDRHLHTEDFEICAMQIVTRLVCIEQYISTGSKPVYVFPECRIGSFAVCMPHMDKQCSNVYAKDLPLNAERQSLLCAWARRSTLNFIS